MTDVYVRLSSSATLSGPETHVEVDTDAGLVVVVGLPSSPVHLQSVLVWLAPQPGAQAIVDPNGHPVVGPATLTLDVAGEGRRFLFVRPTPEGGGYWRVARG